jgi:biuret amidohydrolase
MDSRTNTWARMGFPESSPVRPAVLAIDLHRGHLDPAVATMPVAPGTERRIIGGNAAFLQACRDRGVPVIHAITCYRDVAEIRANPFWRSQADDPDSTRRYVERHNIAGSPGCEIMPEVYDASRDWVVRPKKRYDCFVGTDLDLLLRTHDINMLFVTGINTNSCVLATVSAACARDYAAVVIEDCVQTMDGGELHEAALACIRAAFGWVMSAEDVVGALPASAKVRQGSGRVPAPEHSLHARRMPDG